MYNLYEKPWQHFPVENHLKPRDGYVCYCDLFWIVTEDKCVLRFSTRFQCSRKEETMLRFVDNFQNCSVRYFDVLYFPHDWQDHI